MKQPTKQRLKSQVEKLIADGNAVKATKFNRSKPGHIDFNDPYVDGQSFAKWLTSCRNLVRTIGPSASVWKEAFDGRHYSGLGATNALCGTLEALRDAIDDDLLINVEDLVMADAFAGLLEQANELLDKDYVLAAGVLGRAVLEEHLRKLCEHASCLPPNRPTIGDLNSALYKSGFLSKLEMQTVTAMATAGNHCAHNEQPALKSDDVRDLLERLNTFLSQKPLS
ncbi:MAG TPA: hypothetical protein VMV10_32120 [Pirellulales bacterium]|nr:hypothetical protein [Pirellulales bacterium]